MSAEPDKKKPNKLRFAAGITLLVLSFVLPFGSVWILASKLAPALKAIFVGLLTFGGPEVFGLAAIALLGKECFDFLHSKVFGFLSKLAPSGSVSRARYIFGLIIFILSFIPSFVYAYAPQFIPDNSPGRLYISLSADLIFITSLFVLGGDFWDKLRALFIYEAKAVFPDAKSQH
jgi:hypothetical protein